MGVLTLILERLEFLAYSMRVGVHLLATATILVLTYLFFGWGSALLESTCLGSFLINLWTDMVVPDLANSQSSPNELIEALEDKENESLM